MQAPLVIYHASCMDGVAAAWAVKQRHPDAECFPMHYDEVPPEVRGRDLVVVDFSFPPFVVGQLATSASSFLLLDHHKTALDLKGLPGCHVDRQRSGCLQAWRHFHPDEQVPWQILYINDRDLWEWHLWESRAVNDGLVSAGIPDSVEAFQSMVMDRFANEREAMVVGHTVGAYRASLLRAWTKAPRRTRIAGHEVPIVNVPGQFFSEVGEALAVGEPFAAVWFQRQDGYFVVGLRSAAGCVDVSEVAKSFGGGGHAHAAGFVTSTLP